MIYNVARVRTIFTKFQVEIQAMIYDVARVRRLCTKFQVIISKNKNFHFGGHWGGEGWGDWTAVNIKS